MKPEQYRPELLGNFADVYVGRFEDGQPYVRKVLGEKSGGYSLEQANRVVFLMQRFTNIAHQIDLPLGETYSYSVGESKSGHNRFVVNQTQEYLGRDVEMIIKNDENPISAIRGYFECFRIVAASGFQISLDVHTANFCVDTNGVVRYIDLMSPRQTLEDGTRVAVFPEPSTPLHPFFVDRIFTLEGQLPDMYSKVLRALAYNKHFNNPNSPNLVKALLLETFGENVVTRMLEDVETFKQKDTIDITDVNSIRILAVEKFFGGGLSTAKLEHVYSLTHFSPQGGQPDLGALQEAVMVTQS